jgi:dTDP-4-amino-4,6-dideoxygalactose transaminase
MSTTQIPYVQINRQFLDEEDELIETIRTVLAKHKYVGDSVIAEFESEVAAFCGSRYAVALNSGTDALMLGMMALGISHGDEVITPPNSFVASTSAIVHLGAIPVFADVLPDQNIDPAAIEAAISPRTKAIVAVHLTGRIAQMDRIGTIAEKHGLLLVEDAAQAIGSRYCDRPAGSFGAIGCFSAHPLKNLNACGDSGFLTTNDENVAQHVRRLRSHGISDRNTIVEWGYVSRMDTLQAAILRYRLKQLPQVIEQRRAHAHRYQASLTRPELMVPPCRPEEFNSFHTFVIQCEQRDELATALAKQGIATAIHYPTPIHLQPAAKGLGYQRGAFPVTERQAATILTLPIHQYLGPNNQQRVIEAITSFYRASRASEKPALVWPLVN